MALSEPEDVADLFGDDELFGDEDAKSEQERRLSDRELDSGDDEDRDDRAPDHLDEEAAQTSPNDRDARIMDLAFPRQSIPNSTDGEVR
jgi:RNA polymerase-associated protein LEO1